MSKCKQNKTDATGSAEAVEAGVLSKMQLPNKDSKLTKGKPRCRKRHSRKKLATVGELTTYKDNGPPVENKPATAIKPATESKPTVTRNSAPKHKPADDKENEPSTAATKTKPTLNSGVKSSVMCPGKLAVVPTGEHGAAPAANTTAITDTKQATRSVRKRTTRPRAKPKKDSFDVVKEWNQYWGEGDLLDWQRLSRDLGVRGQLKTKDDCKKAMKDIWINIHDFLQAHPKQSVTRFPTECDLAVYTKASGKLYPGDKTENDSPLHILMAHTGDGAGQRQRAKEKSKPRKYAFVPPPESYESRRPVREVGVV